MLVVKISFQTLNKLIEGHMFMPGAYETQAECNVGACSVNPWSPSSSAECGKVSSCNRNCERQCMSTNRWNNQGLNSVLCYSLALTVIIVLKLVVLSITE